MKLPLSRTLRVALVLASTGVVAGSLVIACSTTSDPRPGVGGDRGGSSGNNVPGGGSGLDAAVPDGPVECGPAPVSTEPFSRTALLGAAADCAAWHACGFQNQALALRAAVRAHAAAPTEATRTETRAAWRSAMSSWSAMELFQFGPVASRTTDKYHGRALRAFVFPWPDTNRCQVETQVVNKTYADGWELVFPSGRGIFALEYLLHYEGNDTACLPNASAAQTWATWTPEQITQAKSDYAVALSENVTALALELTNVWAPGGENFKPKLLAFDGYGSEQETLNVVAWSLMYAEKEIKDWKLAGYAGVQDVPPNPETPFARVDIQNIRDNLRAFRRLFQGCGDDGAGIGFDDWLVAVGQQGLANDMLTALTGAENAAAAFPPFHEATQAQFLAFYNAIKPLSDLLKTSFFGSSSPLNLKLPASAASDTD